MTNRTTTTVDLLGAAAANIAMAAAVRRLADARGREAATLTSTQADRFVELIRAEAGQAIGQAFEDAKDAIDVMPAAAKLAEATFAASLTLAGIKAANALLVELAA